MGMLWQNSTLYLMFPWQPDINLLARATGDPRTLIPAVRAAVVRVNPDLPVFRVRTMRDQIARTLVEEADGQNWPSPPQSRPSL